MCSSLPYGSPLFQLFLSLSVSVPVSVYLNLSLSVSVCLSVHLCLCVSVCLCLSLSVSLSQCFPPTLQLFFRPPRASSPLTIPPSLFHGFLLWVYMYLPSVSWVLLHYSPSAPPSCPFTLLGTTTSPSGLYSFFTAPPPLISLPHLFHSSLIQVLPSRHPNPPCRILHWCFLPQNVAYVSLTSSPSLPFFPFSNSPFLLPACHL